MFSAGLCCTGWTAKRDGRSSAVTLAALFAVRSSACNIILGLCSMPAFGTSAAANSSLLGFSFQASWTLRLLGQREACFDLIISYHIHILQFSPNRISTFVFEASVDYHVVNSIMIRFIWMLDHDLIIQLDLTRSVAAIMHLPSMQVALPRH